MSVVVSPQSASRLVVTDNTHTTTVTVSPSPSILVSATGLQGPSGALSRRHDWASPYDYLGTALIGTIDSSPAWRITRLTINSAGAVTATGVATDVTWTGRASHTYS